MLDKVSGETHTRTIAKAACYRLISMLVSVALTLVLGGNIMQAMTMGGISLFIGSLHYYLYDRIWLRIPWQRDQQGTDTTWRSVVKSAIYRITALLIYMLLARAVFADTNLIAFLLGAGKFVANAAAYFLLERLFNRIKWGKKPIIH